MIWIPQDYRPNFDAEDPTQPGSSIYDFLNAEGNALNYVEPVTIPTGYHIAADPKLVDKAQDKLYLFYAAREYYEVIQHQSVIGKFDVVVPIKQGLVLSIMANLFVLDGTPAALEQRIADAFRNYDPKKDPDPIAYAQKHMGTDITEKMFRVVLSFSLEKDMKDVTAYTAERDALLDYYKGGGPSKSRMDIISADVTVGAYLADLGLRASLVKRELIGRVPRKQYDAVHQVVVKNADDPGPLYKIVDEESKALGAECKISVPDTTKERILTLVEYPEFAIFWEDVAIQIGCVRVVLSVPRLYSRKSRIVLYAYVGRSANIGKLLEMWIRDCAINAAVSAAVVGVVLANFAAALAAFQAIFERCITFKVGQYVQCLIPGLATLHEQTLWARV